MFVRNMLRISKARLLRNPIAISFDVTNRCNLSCPACYWRKFPKKDELELDRIKEMFRQFKKQGTVFCIYLGGEPLMRPDVIRTGSKYIPINWTVTNGTISPPKIRNLLYGVSIDGTPAVHDRIRGKGVYNKAFDNFSGNRDAFIFTTLNSINHDQTERIAKAWSDTSVRGMYINFSTPSRGASDPLWLDWKARDKVVDTMQRLKDDYGDFILLTRKQIEMFRKRNNHLKVKRCRDKHRKNLTASFHSDGKRKSLCTFGASADCTRCGSVCSTLPDSIFEIDSDWRRIYAKLFRM